MQLSHAVDSYFEEIDFTPLSFSIRLSKSPNSLSIAASFLRISNKKLNIFYSGSMNNIFQENPLRQEMEFDFTQGRLWEKRDSEKQIKDNKA